jgi:hypothetical protein
MLEFKFDRIQLQAYSFTPYRRAHNDKKTPLGVDER